MGVSLSKGGNVSLDKPGLTQAAAAAAAAGDQTAAAALTQRADSLPETGLQFVTAGLGWDARTTDGKPFDVDALALLITATGKVGSDTDFVFFNNLKTPDGNVEHTGDNRTGEGTGDDEAIKVNLAGLTSDVQKIVLAANIFGAEEHGQTFGQVRNAYIRLLDQDGNEIARFDLSEDFADKTTVLFGELYRHGEIWKFRALGESYDSGMKGLALDYGVNV